MTLSFHLREIPASDNIATIYTPSEKNVTAKWDGKKWIEQQTWPILILSKSIKQ